MAIEKTIVIKGDTKDAQQSFDALGVTIQEQTDITIQFEKELADLEQQLKDTAKAGFNPKANDIKKQITGLKGAIKDQKIALKDLNNERKKANVALKSNFEEVTKNGGAVAVLDRLTGGLASQVRDSYEATKLFNFSLKSTRTALIATGIGAFVIALGLVVAYWDEIVELITGANKALQKQIDLNTENIKILDTQVTLLKEQEKLLELQGKSTTANRKEQERVLKLLSVENEARLNSLKTQQDITKSKAAEFSFFDKIRLATQASLGIGGTVSLISDDEKTRLKEIQTGIDEATLRAVKLKQQLIEINKPSATEQKKIDTAKSIEQKAIDDETLRQETILKVQETYRLKQQDIDDALRGQSLEREFERELEKLIALEATEEQQRELKLYYTRLIAEEQARLIQQYADVEEQDIIDKEDRRLKREFDNAEKSRKLAEDVENAKRNTFTRTSKLLIQLGGEAAKVGKAIAVAQVIDSGIEGVQNAYTSAQKSPITPFFPAYPLVQAGLAGAFSALQVKNILSSGTGGGGQSPNTNIGGGQPSFTPPSFNLVQGTGSNQIANSLQSQPPVEAFVVASNVSTALELDRNKISASSI